MVLSSLDEESVTLCAGQIDPKVAKVDKESALPCRQVFTFESRWFFGSCHGRENKSEEGGIRVCVDRMIEI
jgi:hypothetical protein